MNGAGRLPALLLSVFSMRAGDAQEKICFGGIET
jgi:hypothetical protein